MLTNINIRGFKSIYQLKDLALGQVNVFVGANGSGKSNLLEAIGVLSAATSGISIDSESLGRRGVRLSPGELYQTNLKEMKRNGSVSFQVQGKWGNDNFDYKVILSTPGSHTDTWNFEEEEFRQNNKKLIGLHDMSDPEISWPDSDEPSGKAPLGSRYALWIQYKKDAPRQLSDHLQKYAIYTPATPVLRGIQPDTMSLDPLGLLGGRLAEAVKEILDIESETLGEMDLEVEVLELLDWVEGFQITTPSRELLSSYVPTLPSVIEFRDYWMGQKRNRISGYDASEGALYVLFMLVLALHPKAPKFFAVDNFGQALNPRLERALSRLFCQAILGSDSSRQVLLTTHNPLVLDGLNLRDERIRLFAVERNQSTNGATKITRVELSENVLKQAETGTPLSQMWVMGLLGGVPDIF